MAGPIKLSVRMYHVGFGDCFLLTFHYRTVDRHLLIDFGTTHQTDSYMRAVALDIAERTAGKLEAIVATHRHKDHLSGFATSDDGSESSGSVIAALAPDLVSLTWTEDPALDPQATGPDHQDANRALVASIRSMGIVAEAASARAEMARRQRRFALARELENLSEINIPNKSALVNLLGMAGEENTEFLHYNKHSRLNSAFRGVRFRVLGPPTVRQWSKVKRQASRDEEEYWHLAARWQGLELNLSAERGVAPFKAQYHEKRRPSHTRWLINQLDDPAMDDALAISRVMDSAINNTSVILLIDVGQERLLFPGDAQIESWDYVLNGPDAEENRELLAGVTVYKVGHHASLNGTPKTLWGLLEHRADGGGVGGLRTLLSSRIDVHGNRRRGSEVPREKLLDALGSGSELITTPWDVPKSTRFSAVGSELLEIDL